MSVHSRKFAQFLRICTSKFELSDYTAQEISKFVYQVFRQKLKEKLESQGIPIDPETILNELAISKMIKRSRGRPLKNKQAEESLIKWIIKKKQHPLVKEDINDKFSRLTEGKIKSVSKVKISRLFKKHHLEGIKIQRKKQNMENQKVIKKTLKDKGQKVEEKEESAEKSYFKMMEKDEENSFIFHCMFPDNIFEESNSIDSLFNF